MSIIQSIIEKQEFATLPLVAAKVLNMLEDDEVDIRLLAQVVETDPSLTLKLLRVANSPLYAIRTEINSIQQAISILGLNRLTNIVLGVSIFSKFLLHSNKKVAEVINKFWWHSSCTGMVSKYISEKLNVSNRDFEFIGGLLHDIGKLAMIQYDVEKFSKTLTLIQNFGFSDLQAETKIFGIDHLTVGEHIAKLWKLPEELVVIIGKHNYSDTLDKFSELTAIVRLADLLCEKWGADFMEINKDIDIEDDICWKVINDEENSLPKIDLNSFSEEIEELFNNSKNFLQLMIQD